MYRDTVCLREGQRGLCVAMLSSPSLRGNSSQVLQATLLTQASHFHRCFSKTYIPQHTVPQVPTGCANGWGSDLCREDCLAISAGVLFLFFKPVPLWCPWNSIATIQPTGGSVEKKSPCNSQSGFSASGEEERHYGWPVFTSLAQRAMKQANQEQQRRREQQ